MKKRILVTGASGFIGTALCTRLLAEGYPVTAAVRRSAISIAHENLRCVTIGSINKNTDWTHAIDNVDALVHLAARVHVMNDRTANPMQAYREVNVEGTQHLAQSAARAGVKRFVFLSSVKVNGEENKRPYSESDKPCPEDSYGISKLEAEIQVATVAGQSPMEQVIIRPPLVYGPKVKANFLALMRLVHRKVPLPLASIDNRRSFVYSGNLVDAVLACIRHPKAAGQTYLVSDDHDLSTPELIGRLAESLQTRAFLFPFPQAIIRSGGHLLKRGETVKRLLGSLTVDISKIKSELGWSPPYSIETGLLNTGKWFKESGTA